MCRCFSDTCIVIMGEFCEESVAFLPYEVTGWLIADKDKT
jgi:hypothetical protein